MQQAFRECHALQCGFCTPGMVLSAVDLLQRQPDPDDSEIREWLEGNLCRCTGYHNIVEAVKSCAPRAEELSMAIGQSIKRKEDARFLTGRGVYTDDIDRPGQLHAVIVRSTLPHARIAGIDAGEALAPRAWWRSSQEPTWRPTGWAACPAAG